MTLAEGVDDNAERAARLTHLRDLALDAGPVAQVVMDAAGRLALANERARTAFSLSERDLGSLFRDLELSYRPVELRSLIEQAYSEGRSVRGDDVERRFPGGEVQYLEVSVVPLWNANASLQGVSITFTDVSTLMSSREELQEANQERETAFEELQSSKEELETTNEELQSSNEELETTNEELQSTNEELQTMNDELRVRTEQLNRSNGFMRTVFRSLGTGIVVLDENLAVSVWNHKVEDLWGVRADEVEGHPFLGLDLGLPLAQLVEPSNRLMRDEDGQFEMVLAALTRRGRTIRCRVAGTPFADEEGTSTDVILVMEEWQGASQADLRQGDAD